MKAVIQRVKNASVKVGGETAGEIGNGLLVFLGVSDEDGERECEKLADKISGLRIFSDEMIRSIFQSTISEVIFL